MHSIILVPSKFTHKQTRITCSTTPRSNRPEHITTITLHISTSDSIIHHKQTCIHSPSPTPSSDELEILFLTHSYIPLTTMSYRGLLPVNAVAAGEHMIVNQPPVVSADKLIPWMVYDFKQFCENYFANTKTLIPEDKKVVQILFSFQDLLIHDWVALCQPHLSSLLFPKFIQKLHTEWLPCDWEDKIWSQILNSHLNASQSFSVWANSLQALNCTLWAPNLI